MRHLLALDQGTSSSRAIVFARTAASARSPSGIHPAFSAAGLGRARRRRDLVQPARGGARGAGARRPAAARHQRHRHHQPARDHGALGPPQRPSGAPRHRLAGPPRRAPVRAAACPGRHERAHREATGLRVDAYFSATKLRWLLDHVSGAHIAAAHGDLAFGTVDSWLVWQLTKGAGARHRRQQRLAHDALRRAPQRLGRELLAALHVPESVLPKVFPSSHLFGHTHPDLFGAPIPIGGIAGDQQSALFGQACFAPGWRRTPTAPAASCSCTPASTSGPRRTAWW
jgi:glycerol kinase